MGLSYNIKSQPCYSKWREDRLLLNPHVNVYNLVYLRSCVNNITFPDQFSAVFYITSAEKSYSSCDFEVKVLYNILSFAVKLFFNK